MAAIKTILCVLYILTNSSCQKDVSQAQALQSVQALPEVIGQGKSLQLSGGATLMMRFEANAKIDGQEAHIIYVGESHPTHTILWHRIAVLKRSGAPYIEDVSLGTFVPLEQWRQSRSQ